MRRRMTRGQRNASATASAARAATRGGRSTTETIEINGSMVSAAEAGRMRREIAAGGQPLAPGQRYIPS